MLFFWTAFVTLNIWSVFSSVPMFTHPRQNLEQRARGTFGASCMANVAYDIVMGVHSAARDHAKRNSIGTAVGFPIITTLGLYHVPGVNEAPRGWNTSQAKPVGGPSAPVSIVSVCAALFFTRREKKRSITSMPRIEIAYDGTGEVEYHLLPNQDAKRKKPFSFLSEWFRFLAPGTSVIDADSGAEPEAGSDHVDSTGNPPMAPTDSHPEAGPSSPHLAGQRPDLEQVNADTAATTAESGRRKKNRKNKKKKNRPSKVKRARARKWREAHEAERAADSDAESSGDSDSDQESSGGEDAGESSTTPPDLPADSTGGKKKKKKKNRPSQKQRQRQWRRIEAALAEAAAGGFSHQPS